MWSLIETLIGAFGTGAIIAPFSILGTLVTIKNSRDIKVCSLNNLDGTVKAQKMCLRTPIVFLCSSSRRASVGLKCGIHCALQSRLNVSNTFTDTS